MKKSIKKGILFIALTFAFSTIGVSLSNAGDCEDLCTPKEDSTCTAREQTCHGFENMSTIDPIPWP